MDVTLLYDVENLFEPYIRRNSYMPEYWEIVLVPGYIHGLMRGPYATYDAAKAELDRMIESGEYDDLVHWESE